MDFQFLPLRFEFVARESLYFPPAKAGNLLRGALGLIFKRIACRPDCHDTRRCEARALCIYARVFEPAALGAGPSGLADWPRPFVFRARHLDGHTIPAGGPFHFDLNLFWLDPAVVVSFIQTFSALASEGLGPGRGRAELGCVRRLAFGALPERIVFPGATLTFADSLVEPASLDLSPTPSAPSRIRVEFRSPTELKHEHKLADRPEFPVLFGRIRDRLSTLRALYGPGPLDIDFRDSAARAAAVRMTGFQVQHEEAARLSSRTGQTHPLGGFVGFADYEGPLGEFLPYLEAARWAGVGRHAVWGKGEIAIVASPEP